MRPTEGLVLIDRYRFLERIAVGGMGEVWLAQDVKKERDVALKVLREEFTGEPGFVNRFRAEARATSGLAHPGIAQTYAYGEQAGSAYIVMELVVAEPLSETLEREKTIAPLLTINIIAQAARALHAAHLGGVVHRDVKPGNILVDPNGKVKLTDFGIARAVGQPAMTEVGMVMGTAQYLSPEQVNGHPAAPASDIYALGIVAYEMLVGNRPFTGTTPLEIAIRHVEQEVPPLSMDVPQSLAKLVMRALAKDPAHRPASAEIFADELEACGRLLANSAAPSNGLQQISRPVISRKAAEPEAFHEMAEPAVTRERAASGTSRRKTREEASQKKKSGRRKAVATWTGQRLSWLSPPLLALLLLIVFATIGALIAGKIFAVGPTSQPHIGIMANSNMDSVSAYSSIDTSTIKDV